MSDGRKIAYKLASLSPRSLIVAMAAGEFYLSDFNTNRLQWMLHGPNPYILNRPTMMHEVRELNLWGMETYPPSLYHFTSLRKLLFDSESSLLPDDAFSLLRQHVTGLQDLHVRTYRLTTPMLNDIIQMTILESLTLVAHEYDDVPPLGNLQGLKALAICDWYEEKKIIILPSTLEGLTRIETLELGIQISYHLAQSIPVMFPLLRLLIVSEMNLSDDAFASVVSNYRHKEGVQLKITD